MSYVKNKITSKAKQMVQGYYQGLVVMEYLSGLKSGENEYSDIVLNLIQSQEYSDLYFMSFNKTISEEVKLFKKFLYSKDYLEDILNEEIPLNNYSYILDYINNFVVACKFLYGKCADSREYESASKWCDGYYKFDDRQVMRSETKNLLELAKFISNNMPKYIVKNL